MTLNVTLIVSGTHFTTTVDTLRSKEGTRLAKIDYPTHHNNRREYHFDRNAELFSYILDFYRTGELHMPSSACGHAFKNELDYWGINPRHVSICCRDTFTGGHIAKYESYFDAGKLAGIENAMGTDCKAKVFRFFENAYSSTVGAKIPAIIHFLATLVVIASVLVNVTMTVVSWQHARNHGNRTLPEGYYLDELAEYDTVILKILYIVAAVYIVIDYLIRLITCPFSKKDFLLAPFNLLDLIIIPFLVIGAVVFYMELGADGYLILLFISTGQLLLIFRLAKPFRHFRDVKILYLTFKSSVSEMFLFLFIYTFVCLFFACIVLLCEFKQPGSDFDEGFFSIFYSMFWSLVTMTTVGYGDMIPTTNFGKVCAGICAFSGLIMLAWVIGIISSNFSVFLKYARKLESRKLVLVSVSVKSGARNAEELTLLSNEHNDSLEANGNEKTAEDMA